MSRQRSVGTDGDGVPARAQAWWSDLDRGWRAALLAFAIVVVHLLAG
jgi:hypothetical protein